MRILLVEDDPASADVLTRYLADQRYVVDTASDGETGWQYASTYDYDLLILDVILPQLDGISLCQRLRSQGYTTPIMLLTAQDSSSAKIMGLDSGADDYVVKPFDPTEWIARIRALLRRGSTNPLPVLTWGNLWLNLSTSEVTYDGQTLTLSAKEYALLELFLRESQHVFSNEEILESLWASDEFPVEATVRSHIRRLRRKLTIAGAPTDFITTAHGRGYYLKPLNTSPTSTPSTPTSTLNSTPDFQVQYQAMLQQVWADTQPRIQQHLQQILAAVDRLRTHELTPDLQQQASQASHTLAGTLGTLGQLPSMLLAQELEQWFHQDIVLAKEESDALNALVTQLCDRIESASFSTTSMTATPLSWQSPELIVVDPAQRIYPNLVNSIRETVLQVTFLPTYQQAINWFLEDGAKSLEPISGLILALSDSPSPHLQDGGMGEALELLQIFSQRYPHCPVIVSADALHWSDRLHLVQHGAKCILPCSTPAHKLVEMWRHLQSAEQQHRGKRVMLVDDDPAVLRTLPSQLQSFGLEVSTLNDPQQFWHILEVIQPDVLVLDVRMPCVNGLELCQLLRSDPHWQQLPIFFLSVVNDGQTQSKAFAVGADDYLCKPVTGSDLAHRIVSRLQRIQVWQSAS